MISSFELTETTVFAVFAVKKPSSSLSRDGKCEYSSADIRASDAIPSNASLLGGISGTALASATVGLTVQVIFIPKKVRFAIRSTLVSTPCAGATLVSSYPA